MNVMRSTQEAKERLCVHCADGQALTSVVLADWMCASRASPPHLLMRTRCAAMAHIAPRDCVRSMVDLIGGNNYMEGCDALAARKRLAGVERRPEPEQLEAWTNEGHL